MNKHDVIIIGSGLGGLLCGFMLSKEGYNVCILEMHNQPGGNLQTFVKHGSRFETGVHYIGALGEGQTLARYWNYFGLMNKLKFQQLDPDCFDRISFGNEEFPLAQGFENFKAQLLEHFPESKTFLDQYIDKIQEVVSAFPLYHLELPGDHHEHHYTTQSAHDFLANMAHCKAKGSSIPLSSVLAGNNYLYGGSTASPLHVASLINHSFISGAYRIIGGSDQVSQVLTQSLTMQGGKVLTRHKVSSIEQVNKKFLVKTDNGNMFQADIVISDIHPAETLALLPPDMVRTAYQKRIASLQNTTSSFILYLKVKPGSFPYLNYNYYHHTSVDPWNEYAVKDHRWPEMFLLSTDCQLPDQKYAETVTILTYMNFEEMTDWENTLVGKRGRDYTDFKEQKADKLLELVEQKFPGITAAIEFRSISTPLTYRDYTGTPQGSLYGIQKNFRDPMLTTVLPKTKISNLYFTGQNTNLHGVLGVTIGSVVTCGEIVGLEYLLKKINHG